DVEVSAGIQSGDTPLFLTEFLQELVNCVAALTFILDLVDKRLPSKQVVRAHRRLVNPSVEPCHRHRPEADIAYLYAIPVAEISNPVAVVGDKATELGGHAGQALEPSAVRLDVSGVPLQRDVLALAQRAGRSTELTIGVSLGCTKAKDRTNRTLGAVGHLELGLQLTPRPHAILLVEVQFRLDLAAELGLDLGGRRKRQSQHQDETR